MMQKANINTYVMVAGFLLTLAANYGAYKSFESATNTTLAEIKAQRAVDITRMESKTSALEVAVQGLSIQDARQIEQINAMLSYLQRIERTLEKLVETEKQ